MEARFNASYFKSQRKRKNISQSSLADMADTSERYIRDLEKGKKTNPSASLLFRLSMAMEIPMENLMTRIEGES